MFSVPLNQKLSEQQFNEFLSFLVEYKEYIYDIYFTCRMPPFSQDAMGDIITSDADIMHAIEAALHVQNVTGIPVSATFNNILVPPNQQALDLFVQNFRQLYEAGVRSATIPHTHWLATGIIQAEFPELFVKNTILRNVQRPNEIAKLAEAGFKYVNLDRDLMRDRDTLIQMRKVADKYGIKLALLANEGCLGGCPMMDEHFQFNMGRIPEQPNYFNDPISRVSCPKWDVKDPSTPLKTANIPPWREDWVELLEFVDVFKMHGRESAPRLYETMDIIKRYANNDEFLFAEFQEYIEDTELKDRPIDAWRKKIKNCKFDCWDCNFCDKVYASKKNERAHPFTEAVVDELVNSATYSNNLEIPGLTSKRVQNLLFAVGSHVNSYLEVGSAMGATAAAVALNEEIEMHCVDNWEEQIQPMRNEFDLPVNSKTEFMKNTKHAKNLTIHDSDMLSVDKTNIKNIDMFFYDGPHDVENTKAALSYYKECLSDVSILIFDDANWTEVGIGATEAVLENGFEIMYSKNLLNEIENPNMWWNGLKIMVVKK